MIQRRKQTNRRPRILEDSCFEQCLIVVISHIRSSIDVGRRIRSIATHYVADVQGRNHDVNGGPDSGDHRKQVYQFHRDATAERVLHHEQGGDGGVNGVKDDPLKPIGVVVLDDRGVHKKAKEGEADQVEKDAPERTKDGFGLFSGAFVWFVVTELVDA